ncbi:hypothetical protein NM688_g988 [Phlebia brevispora]|uniref:Uncharacterized protein n=1 Tax=Phlebia brevispora TaxID=194682 RepID=A0ACC1TCJ2_9APHY|nr:hypothetical protein NM688_g988 [Phlebia brevispora]
MVAISKRVYLNVVVLGSLALSSSAQSLADLNCLTEGRVFNCTNFINSFCTQSGQVPVLGQNTVSQCFVSEFNCNFYAWRGEVANTGAAGEFDQANCESVLQTITNVCPRGGSGRVVDGSFWFTVNPNDASCGNVTVVSS